MTVANLDQVFLFTALFFITFLSLSSSAPILLWDSSLSDTPPSPVVLGAAHTLATASSNFDQTNQIKWAPSFTIPTGETWEISQIRMGFASIALPTSMYFNFYEDSNGLPPVQDGASIYNGSYTLVNNYTSLGLVQIYNASISNLILTGGANYWVEFFAGASATAHYLAVNLNFDAGQRKQAVWCGTAVTTCSSYLNGSSSFVLYNQNVTYTQGVWSSYMLGATIYGLVGNNVGVCCLPNVNYTCSQATQDTCLTGNGTYLGDLSTTNQCTAQICVPSPSPSMSPSVTVTPTASLSIGASPSPSASRVSNSATASLSFGASPSVSPSLTPSPTNEAGELLSWLSWGKNLL